MNDNWFLRLNILQLFGGGYVLGGLIVALGWAIGAIKFTHFPVMTSTFVAFGIVALIIGTIIRRKAHRDSGPEDSSA